MEKYILILVKNEYSKTPYDKWLLETNIVPIIFVSDKFSKEYAHVKNVYIFKDYEKNVMVKEDALKLAKSLNIIGVFSRAESDLIRASEIRELLNLPGQNRVSARAYRNKVIMKNYLINSDINIPIYKKVESSKCLVAFAEENGFPFVVKPQEESGSTGVAIINNDAELDDYISKTKLTDLEVEEFIEGKMFHIDGLVVNNEIVFVQPFQYINDCLAYRENNYIGGCMLSPKKELSKKLIIEVEKIIKKLPTPNNMAFHTEIWGRDNGELVFCEIASRTGGATISSSIEYSFDFNIDEAWLLAECQISNFTSKSNNYKPSGWLAIPPLDGVLKKLPINKKTYIKNSHYSGEEGKRYFGGVKSGLFLAGYAISGENEEMVQDNIHDTAEWFRTEAIWEIKN